MQESDNLRCNRKQTLLHLYCYYSTKTWQHRVTHNLDTHQFWIAIYSNHDNWTSVLSTYRLTVHFRDRSISLRLENIYYLMLGIQLIKIFSVIQSESFIRELSTYYAIGDMWIDLVGHVTRISLPALRRIWFKLDFSLSMVQVNYFKWPVYVTRKGLWNAKSGSL